jgi:hypothetical protein
MARLLLGVIRVTVMVNAGFVPARRERLLGWAT